ncbi:MAG: RNA polymerase sigma-54 factor, partial [Elioraea tepidiphila]
MAIGPRLDLRLGQALVMTPQLRQAIQLLQFSNLEVQAWIEQELERNPLLERDDRPGELAPATPAPEETPPLADAREAVAAAGEAVGARIARADGLAKVRGTDRFGADSAPP